MLPALPHSSSQIVASSPGWWDQSSCTTPALWILLVGHYRTFSWTRESWRRLATHSSGCSMAVAFMPNEIDVPDAERRWWRKHDVSWRQIAPEHDGVPTLMANAQHNFPNLAYVVVRRTGAVNGFPACLGACFVCVCGRRRILRAECRIRSTQTTRACCDRRAPRPLTARSTLLARGVGVYPVGGARTRHPDRPGGVGAARASRRLFTVTHFGRARARLLPCRAAGPSPDVWAGIRRAGVWLRGLRTRVAVCQGRAY